MSDSSPDIAGLIAEANAINLAYRVAIAGTVLVLYDYALTISTEISEVWNSKFSGATALFFMIRYSYMVSQVLYSAENSIQNPSQMSCRVLAFGARVLLIMTQIGLIGILVLRTYAIYQRHRLILAALGLVGVADVAVGVYLEVLATPEVVISVYGSLCGQNAPSIYPRIRLVSTILAFAIDVLVFFLTFTKTIHHVMEMRKLGLRNGLGYFILRDGTIYFLAQLLFGVVSIIGFLVPASGTIGNWLGVAGQVTNSLTVILINRLVLNLRQVSHFQDGKPPTLGTIGTIQEPAFAANSLLGNLGAPLRVDPEDEEEPEEVGVDDEAGIVEEHGFVDHGGITEEPRGPSDA